MIAVSQNAVQSEPRRLAHSVTASHTAVTVLQCGKESDQFLLRYVKF